MLKYFLNINPARKEDILWISTIILISTSFSYLFSFLLYRYLGDEIRFNIFNVIPIYVWIYPIVLGILFIALFRTVMICLVARIKISKNFIPIYIKIIQIGFLCISLLIPIILISTNKMVITTFGLSKVVSLNKSLVIGMIFAILFGLLWFLGLSFTIKRFLQIRMKKIKAFAVNLISSIFAGIVVGALTFLSIPVEKYEITFAREALLLKQKLGLITPSDLERQLNKYKEQRNITD